MPRVNKLCAGRRNLTEAGLGPEKRMKPKGEDNNRRGEGLRHLRVVSEERRVEDEAAPVRRPNSTLRSVVAGFTSPGRLESVHTLCALSLAERELTARQAGQMGRCRPALLRAADLRARIRCRPARGRPSAQRAPSGP